MESLARLGSSAELKNNLKKLINQYLKIVLREKEKGYLVVQVDDADLSLGNVFQICENIRNYFSIPNVIVMMAADYGQLKAVIHQSYLKQYERMIQLQPESGFANQCNTMTARYLEKMLPEGHRVTLPDVNVMISESFQSIKLLYYSKKEGETEDLLSEVLVGCNDLQEQLMKLLYIKTGVVLLKRVENYILFATYFARVNTFC